ncbi:MAG: ABC transporter ATP-binding protein [Deltaproteobacteria bacterium]|nr:ABC transporter ATP-binding protein [Deltaproteobacteria bacterium]
MLQVSNINSFYRKIQALWGVSLRIDEKELVALIGANGAGKTTLLKTISGLLHPASGSVQFLDMRIDQMPAHSIVELGVSHVSEGRRLFQDMTVRENLDMGAYTHKAWNKKEETLERVHQIFPILKVRSRQLARTLSGGEQQMLAMGRGLMSRPRLCMFDELSYGLAPILAKEVFKIVKTLREQDIAILLVEQNVRHALEIADRAYVLENGRIVLEGESRGLSENELIKQAYLGL